VPVLWYLSGLTCTHENAMVKAGAQAWAAEQGIALVFPDTSPRGEGVADDDAYDLGQGAGFYVNATQDPWAEHFQMWDYVTEELPRACSRPLRAGPGAAGDHRAFHGRARRADHRDGLPGRFASVSAFAPICNPTGQRLGPQAVHRLSGREHRAGEAHDATLLMRERALPGPILIDTGTADQFGDLLKTEAWPRPCARRQQRDPAAAAGL
jgi:S-formylglutathione hydrolase